MKFLLEIDCDNAAFADDPAAEVARLLHEAAARVADVPLDHRAAPMGRLRDYNGNTVGSFRFEQED